MFRFRIAAALVVLTTALQLTITAGSYDGAYLAAARRGAQSQADIEKEAMRLKVETSFSKLVDEYFESCFRSSPNWGTESGFHEWDDRITTNSAREYAQRVAELKTFREKFSAINPEDLTPTSRMDREILLANTNAGLLEIESIQSWRRDPDQYSSKISSYVFSLMKRNFSPLKERLRCVIAREKAAADILENARVNLENPSKIAVEVAIEQLPGTISFFETAVPAAFAAVDDPTLQAEFRSVNDETIRQLKIYQTYLRELVLPRATPNFAIGKENYQKKLAYDELVDEPIDTLLAQGYDELHRLQKEFVEIATKIDPSKSAHALYEEVSSEHPKPEQLISAVQGVLSGLRTRCQSYVTIPTEDELKVQETPPFMRATTFASMDTPGPYETQAKEAYYQVTLPEKDWDAKRAEQHMRFFCTLDLINTSVHEAYPGHYVQGLWAKQAPSKTRKLISCGTVTEGWAHYCEQMMVETKQPQDLKLKLVQIHDALLRAARYIVGIEMHTKSMTFDQAKQFFVKEGYQEPANGEREAKRGTGDPTYLVYTLGKLQILQLLEDYKRAKGDKFNLKEFHNDFLAQGYLPIKLMRQAILPKEQPGRTR